MFVSRAAQARVVRLRMKLGGAREVALVLTTLGTSGCLAPPRHPAITPAEVAKLGCYELTLDGRLADYPTFPEFLRVRLDSSHAYYGRLLASGAFPEVPNSFEFWEVLSADSLLLRFGRNEGIEVRLGGPVDSLEGWAIERDYSGVPATTPWFTRAHAARIDCRTD